jgi:two-component system, sensor histidine kinase and response regulator
MATISILAVAPSSALAAQLRAYLKAYQPRYSLQIASSASEAVSLLQERSFDSVWFESGARALGLAEVAMVFVPHEVIAVVRGHDEAVLSLDQGASSVAYFDDDTPPWPLCVRLTENALGREAQLKALQLSEQRLESAINGANLGLWFWSVAQQQLVITERWRQYLGYPRDEMKTGSCPWTEMVPEDYAVRVREAVNSCIHGAEAFFSLEVPLKRAQGDDRWVLIVGGVAHRSAEGVPVQLAGVLLDAHERKLYQLEMERRRESAEATVGTQNYLLATMNHEFRTPLSIILGYGEILLREDLLDADRLIATEAILASARGLLKIINNTITLSRLDSTLIGVKKEPIALAKILIQAESSIHLYASVHSTSIETELPETRDDTIHVDPSGLRQILQHILQNAVKFSPKGTVVLKGGVNPSEDRFEIGIVDNGVGMSPDEVARVSIIGGQLEPEITRRYSGLGVGLSICSRLARVLGLELAVQSKKGEGTTVWIRGSMSGRDLGAADPAKPGTPRVSGAVVQKVRSEMAARVSS